MQHALGFVQASLVKAGVIGCSMLTDTHLILAVSEVCAMSVVLNSRGRAAEKTDVTSARGKLWTPFSRP